MYVFKDVCQIDSSVVPFIAITILPYFHMYPFRFLKTLSTGNARYRLQTRV